LEDESDHPSETIWLATFNRYPRALQETLEHGVELRRCREALEAEGYDWRLASGTTVFVHPWQYVPVLRELSELARPAPQRDIVFADSLDYLLELDLAAVESISGSFHGAWIKVRHELPVDMGSGDPVSSGPDQFETADAPAQDLYSLRAMRTFLCVVPLRRNTTSIVQSETAESEADNRRNPRRAVAAW